jgi:hypothetical protein
MAAAAEEQRHDDDRGGAELCQAARGLLQARLQMLEISELDKASRGRRADLGEDPRKRLGPALVAGTMGEKDDRRP